MIVYSDSDFTLECVDKFGAKFLHCEVASWKLSSFKKGLRVFNSFIKNEAESGTKFLITVTPNPKFAELLGGKFVESVEHEGKEYKVYIWELNSLLQPL